MNTLLGGLSVCLLIAAAAVGAASAEPNIQGKTVEYNANGMIMKGYLAYAEGVKKRRPGVLVVPEWWGLTDYPRTRAQMLAELGYTALAVDMFGGGKVVTTPDEAQRLVSELMKNFDIAKARFNAAMDFLRQQPGVDPSRIAAIGYCFGGGIALNMARQGADLKGVASFHGNLTPIVPAHPGAVKAKILVLHGADDPLIPNDQAEAFKREMKAAGVDFQFISYPGAVHAFTNPEATALGKKFNLPVAYNAQADRGSWDELKKFLGRILK